MKKRLIKLALSGVLIAMSVVIGIVCKNLLTYGIYYRITFENLPVITAGIILGPLYGAVIGALSDVVSCISSVNPVVNPIITLGAAGVGFISGLIPKFLIKKRSFIQYAISAYAAHLVGQVIIKSIGKIVYYNMPVYGVFIGLAISAAVATVEIFIIKYVLKLPPLVKLEKTINGKTYKECMVYIEKIRSRGSRMSLDALKSAMKNLGDPQDKIKIIHVAGTNGKGSFCKMLSSVLAGSGYKTGLFISPFLTDHTDALYISGVKIKRDEFAGICGKVMKVGERYKLTEYEFLTAVAYLWFYESGVDVAVVECCMGGTNDATNVVKAPALTCITGVAMDHMRWLGNTPKEIASNKAGIIKPGCPVILGVCDDDVRETVLEKADALSAPVYTVVKEDIIRHSLSFDGIELSYKAHEHVKVSLIGDHQFRNTAAVLEACDLLVSLGFNITEDIIKSSLENVKFEARFEKLSGDPVIVYDGAHNVDGVKAFIETYKQLYGSDKCILITGVLADKEYRKMAELLCPLADNVLAVAPSKSRALPANDLADAYRSFGADVETYASVQDAVRAAIDLSKSGGRPVFAVGSLYMYTEFKASAERLLNS